MTPERLAEIKERHNRYHGNPCSVRNCEYAELIAEVERLEADLCREYIKHFDEERESEAEISRLKAELEEIRVDALTADRRRDD